MSPSLKRSVKNWLIAGLVVCLIVAVGLFLSSLYFVAAYQPEIRQLAVTYLEQRFDAQVELAALNVHLPEFSPLQLLLARGKGAIARVQGSGLILRRHGFARESGGEPRLDGATAPPMFSAKAFSFELDLGSLLSPPVVVPRISVEGMEINVPPRGQRPALAASSNLPVAPSKPSRLANDVTIANIEIVHSQLRILPQDPTRAPLEFTIHELHLQPHTAGPGMAFQVKMDNPKPPGAITAQGTFGPWNTATPADSPMQGSYVFQNADLSVFSAIAGKLESTGKFTGTLGAITADGRATVPDFRLKRSGNPVPLTANFEALVDGQNGNTTLRPVRARLGRSEFVTSGTVMSHEKESRKAIELDVDMPHGDMRDVLRLAMKGDPFLEGDIDLKARIEIPPSTGTVQQKLILDGRFAIDSGHFTSVNVQNTLDALSRRAQGRPSDHSIDDVFSSMNGVFHMEDQRIFFSSLGFAVPGALVELHGGLGLEPDSLDFHGDIKMQARISDMVTGWKKWIARPIDPFFEKNGAGTYLKIKIGGSTKSPTFGLDR